MISALGADSAARPRRSGLNNNNNHHHHEKWKNDYNDNDEDFSYNYNNNDDDDDNYNYDNYDDDDDNEFDYLDVEDDEILNEPVLFDMDSSHQSRDHYASNSSPRTNTKNHFFSRKPLTDPSFLFLNKASAAAGTEEAAKVVLDQLCRGAGITQPSRIQSLAWPIVLQGHPTMIADQTGSGKYEIYIYIYIYIRNKQIEII